MDIENMHRRLKSFSFLCVAILLLICIICVAAYAEENCNAQSFKTVVIGNRTWMAENLNCNVSGSVCYDNDDANCGKYGRLYNWATAMNLPGDCNSAFCQSKIRAKHQGICPSGFHIPTDAEWDALYSADGSKSGTKLKAASGWNFYSGRPSGTDAFGFSALPGGFGSSDGNFYSAAHRSFWWSATERYTGYAYGWGLHFHEKAYRDSYVKSSLFSVRCVKDVSSSKRISPPNKENTP